MTTTVAALWKREIIKFVRDRSRLFGALMQPLGFWLLLGLGFYSTFQMPGGEDVGYLEYLYPGIIALILLFTAVFTSITIIAERQSGFLQAALVAPVSRLALVLGNVLGGTTIAVAQALLFLMLAPLVGVAPSVPGVLLVLLTGLLLAAGFTALGFVIAWRRDTIRGYHAVMNLLLLPMWFLSGAFFPLAGAPTVLRWVMLANPVTYGVSVIRQALYLPGPAPGTDLPLAVALGVTALFTAAMLSLAVRTMRRSLY